MMNFSILKRYYKPFAQIRAKFGVGHYILIDSDKVGEKVLVDCDAGGGAAFAGHRNPRVIANVVSTIKKISALMITYDVDVRQRFDRYFGEVIPSGYDVVYLQNTGTEAVELALKIAKYVTGRRYIISFKNSFHGRTLGALSATYNEEYRKYFEPLYEYVRFFDFVEEGGTIDANSVLSEIEKFVKEHDVCCILLEPIQGEGGVNVADPQFLRGLKEISDRHGIVLIFDEIQSGLGRTSENGERWAFEYYNVEPDIFTVGKALGGGLPISAVVANSRSLCNKVSNSDAKIACEDAENRKTCGVLRCNRHGSTFAGNPITVAGAVGFLENFIKEEIPVKVAKVGRELKKALNDAITDNEVLRRIVKKSGDWYIRGRGLMLGIPLPRNTVLMNNIRNRLLHYGITIMPSYKIEPSENVIRLLCPYTLYYGMVKDKNWWLFENGEEDERDEEIKKYMEVIRRRSEEIYEKYEYGDVGYIVDVLTNVLKIYGSKI